ncbi:TRI10 protein, partial [Rhinopomastus cyanomelas]|nr:TRI10 protein [Rhinopomastus cyanomelas]
GGGTARSWPERGRFGDAEAVGYRRQLRRGNFQSKQHLEHLVEKLKLLGLEGGKEKEDEDNVFSWHKRTLASKGVTKPSGSNHDEPRADDGPTAAEESTQDKEQRLNDLEKLKKQRDEIWELKISGEKRCQDYLTQTEIERQKVVAGFRRLRQFLKDQELVLLVQLGELNREMMRRQEEEETKTLGELSLLDVLICEMEKKLEEPSGGFLQVGSSARHHSLWWAMRAPETFSDLEQQLHIATKQNKVLMEMLERFQAFVTLDPDTAHPSLALSRDRRAARWADEGRDVPPRPGRLAVPGCVLARQGFALGSHCWEVEVASAGTCWALGVARSSAARAGWLRFGPEEGVWAVGWSGGRLRAFTRPATAVAAPGGARRLRVALDCGAGTVRFYVSGRQEPLFSFREASFSGERVFPFFWL